MKLHIASTAGFCFGVKRAVELVESAADSGKQTVTLGPIIHNRNVTAKLSGLGVREIAEVSDIPEGSTVVIRSHGVGRAVYEALQNRKLEIVDATCPFVSRIHGLVRRGEQEGKQPVIMGQRQHPEVTAIAGWCSNPMVFESAEELEEWLLSAPENPAKPLFLVFQTTSTQALYKKSAEIAKKVCTNCEIFDTICKATEDRQSEAACLAGFCDAMIVIGDRTSANTGKLAAICKERCGRVYPVENASELPLAELQDAANIGITAGASTPAWIIKEVINTMDEEIKIEEIKTADPAPAEEAAPAEAAPKEESFEALLDASIKTLNTGDRVTGIVTSIGNTEVQVDLGTKHAGYIPFDEVSSDPNLKPEDVLKVGDEIKVFVVRVNDQEGTVQLSKKKIDGEKVWDELEAASESREPQDAVITDVNKGGLVANVKGIRVFVPASASGVARGGNLEGMKGKNVRLRITEVSRGARGRVVGSIRDVVNAERKAAQEKIWNEIEIGKKYHGKVKSLTSYGAFVDVGGVDGMVHVSELSWRRIKNPAEVVKVGDEIDVYVISFDPEKKKISLGYKTAEMNPWNQFTAKYSVGDVVPVKIVKMMTFGAFAEILPGVDGLIHISQIANRRINKPEDVLTVGQEVEVKIIGIDAENKRISLSIRALIDPTVEEQAEALAEGEAEVPVELPAEPEAVAEAVEEVAEAPVEE